MQGYQNLYKPRCASVNMVDIGKPVLRKGNDAATIHTAVCDLKNNVNTVTTIKNSPKKSKGKIIIPGTVQREDQNFKGKIR